MKKLLITIAMVALTFSMNAQEKYQVTRIQGYGVKSGKIFFTIDKGEVEMTAKGKSTEQEYEIVLDTEKRLVFDVVGGLNKTRYTLTRDVKYPSLQFQNRDSFSGETTTQLWMIKKVN